MEKRGYDFSARQQEQHVTACRQCIQLQGDLKALEACAQKKGARGLGAEDKVKKGIDFDQVHGGPEAIGLT